MLEQASIMTNSGVLTMPFVTCRKMPFFNIRSGLKPRATIPSELAAVPFEGQRNLFRLLIVDSYLVSTREGSGPFLSCQHDVEHIVQHGVAALVPQPSQVD